MNDTLQKLKQTLLKTYERSRLIDVVFYTFLILSLSSIVLIRNYNYLFILITIISGIYRILTGYQIKRKALVILISIIGGAYIAYRSYSLGALSIPLGLLSGIFFITSYNVLYHEKE